MKRGERTGATVPPFHVKIPLQAHSDSPTSLPFSSFYSSAKHEGTLQEAALPNTESSLLAPELGEERTATL
jgi:hypothetical protein